jgi:apolipoprotein N-acyltransferase
VSALHRPSRATLVRLVAAAASGAIAAASRPPLDLGPLACVALVPLFLVWRDRRPRAAAGYAFVAGAVYYALVCSWVWYFGAVAIVPFVAACAAYWAGAGALVAWLRDRGFANPFLTAAIWIVADAGVARFPLGGLSWGELGYAFHNVEPARAVASVGGLALVTFVAVAINGFLADAVVAVRAGDVTRRSGWLAGGVAVLAVIVVGSTVTQARPHVTSYLRVALVQGNDKDRELTDAELDNRYLPASHFALAQGITGPVDLIVFPESSMDADPRTDRYVHDGLVAVAKAHHAYVLANATVDADPSGAKSDNLDVLFAPTGEIIGTYSKRHLVPYGEYVPFRSQLQPLIPELDKVPRDFIRGKGPGLFDVAGTRLATVICFESAFGYQIRPLVRDGAQAIVVSTNNRSYRRSANSAQHIAIGQMRAAETGRPVVQAAISGISAVIDADGTVHDQTHLFDRTVVDTTIATTSGQTPYVRFGEWATLAAIAVVLIIVVFALARRRKRRRVSVDLTTEETVSIASRLEHYGSQSAESSNGDGEAAPVSAPTPAEQHE